MDDTVVPATEQAQYQSLFATGTRLPGWALLIDRIHMALLRSHRVNRHCGVLVFTNIADLATLKVAAAHLTSQLRPDDTVAELSESTLVAVCNDITSRDALERVLERLLEHVGFECETSMAMSDVSEDAVRLLERALAQGRRRSA